MKTVKGEDHFQCGVKRKELEEIKLMEKKVYYLTKEIKKHKAWNSKINDKV